MRTFPYMWRSTSSGVVLGQQVVIGVGVKSRTKFQISVLLGKISARESGPCTTVCMPPLPKWEKILQMQPQGLPFEGILISGQPCQQSDTLIPTTFLFGLTLSLFVDTCGKDSHIYDWQLHRTLRDSTIPKT